MPSTSPTTGLTITNPLVLYRALLASKKIQPDPSQHRLAIHLQKLYHRLKDYHPEIDYSHHLDQLSRAIGVPSSQFEHENVSKHKSILSAFKFQKQERDALALTKKLTNHESAISLQTPQGLLLYGEVGTGKSMLIDLLADCLPTQKKRRWHFNTFMLETFARLEHLRRERQFHLGANPDEEHSLLWLAREMISTSPIVFVDEFQLPDRAASKILSNLFTSFFHLGGVLIATSNRMPEELANASGVEFAAPPSSRLGLLGNRWGLLGPGNSNERSAKNFPGTSDFTAFLDVLRARCETWDIEGGKDWRREDEEGHDEELKSSILESNPRSETGFNFSEPAVPGNWETSYDWSMPQDGTKLNESRKMKASHPKHYFLNDSPSDSETINNCDINWDRALLRSILALPSKITKSADIPWETTSLRVYGRNLIIPRHLSGVTMWKFSELCRTILGPADYISIASTFHTLILTEVPILTLIHKNEARRLITLLDALYEARCKLLVRAAAGPDSIFFPETQEQQHAPSPNPVANESADQTYPETFSEIYQDQTSPFRPNVSPYYSSSTSPPSYPTSLLSSPSQPTTRSIHADEDSDFGPIYGAGRRFPTSLYRGVGDGVPGTGHEIGSQQDGGGPDFTRGTGIFTGEDEKFAYKRARSRLWEMCGSRWWSREGVVEWWKPVAKEVRRWEGAPESPREPSEKVPEVPAAVAYVKIEPNGQGQTDDGLSRHGTSPFLVSFEPPPKFSWTHAWGMMRWGKKAGVWGKGVEGLAERKK